MNKWKYRKPNGASSRASTINLIDEQRAEQNKEFKFYLKAQLASETLMEEAYFKGQRIYHKKNKNIYSHCGLQDNHIQKPTGDERLFLSFPPLHSKNSPGANPKPIHGSSRL
jgi:hypothetical protein